MGARVVNKGVIIAIAAVVALIAGFVTGGVTRGPAPSLNTTLKTATVMEGAARSLPTFNLTDHRGEPFTPARLNDRWSFVFFGYTYCPDVCPLTLNVMSEMMKSLDSEVNPADVDVYFVSVDPKRDTLDRLAQYVPFFDERFVGVTGERTDLDVLTRGLSSIYALGEPDESGHYLVDHSASVLLINPDGQFYGVFAAPHDPKEMADDFSAIYKRHT